MVKQPKDPPLTEEKITKLEELLLKSIEDIPDNNPPETEQSTTTTDTTAINIRDKIVRLMYHPSKQTSSSNSNNFMNKSNKQKQILECIKRNTAGTTQNKSKSKRFLKALFHGLGHALKFIVEGEEYLPLEDEVDCSEEDKLAITYSLYFLKCCADMLHAYLDGVLSRNVEKQQQKKGDDSIIVEIKVLDEALGLAELLHDVLFALSSTYANVDADDDDYKKHEKDILIGVEAQQSISNLCEKWWLNHCKGRDLLVTQLLPLLLIKSLHGQAKQADVKRMFQVSDALDLLDFDDEESISYLKSLLCRTLSTPLYLKNPSSSAGYGRKFIVGLFVMAGQQENGRLMEDLHQAVRAQIPNAKLPVLQV